jgi:membrane protein DedA with SNARE-associated domain
MAVFSIVLYGGYLFYKKTIQVSDQPNLILSAIIVATFLATICLYYGGYCFHEDKNEADWYHSLMHILSSIGHHFIIIL